MMETKKSKYDTNPLDPDVERKAEEVWGELGGDADTASRWRDARSRTTLANENARQNVYSEAPTRRYDNPPLEAPYPSVFVPPTYAPPTQYQPATKHLSGSGQPVLPHRDRCSGIGIPEKWAMMLPYAPVTSASCASLLELFLVPRKEVRVRFHASQALALHIAILDCSNAL